MSDSDSQGRAVVSLAKLAEEMTVVSSDWGVWYNRLTGEFTNLPIDNMYVDMDEFEEELEAVEADPDWIALPSQWDIHEHAIMVEFADSLPDGSYAQRDLDRALHRSGAFRRFKDGLNRHGLREAWFAFQDQEYRRIARRWCEENDIEYTDAG